MMKKLSLSCILSVSLYGAVLSSCVEPNTEPVSQVEADDESLLAIIDSVLLEINEFESDVARGFLLRSLREKDRQEFEDILYEIRLSLNRLRRDRSDQKAAERLSSFKRILESQSLLQADQARIEKLTPPLNAILKILDFVFQEEQFSHTFNTGFGPFKTLQTIGGATWSIDNARSVAVISGFQKGVTESWLISPVFDLTELQLPYFETRQAVGYLRSWDDLELVVSTNYLGGHPDMADWEALFIERIPRGDINWESVTSEKVSLERYAGEKVVIAFRYRSLASQQATWQINFFKLGGAGRLGQSSVDVSLDLNTLPDAAPLPSKPIEILLENSFEKDLKPFTNYTLVGGAGFNWNIDSKFKVARVSGNRSGANNEAEIWMVSPKISLQNVAQAFVSFEQVVGYFTSWDEMKLMVANDFAGDPALASWQELVPKNRPSGQWESVKTGQLSLDEFLGQEIVIGFQYRSTTAAAATWQIKDFKLGVVLAD